MLQRTEQRSSISSFSVEPILLAIEPERLGDAWPLAEPHLQRALTRTPKWDLLCCRESCEKGHALLWIAWDPGSKVALGALITDILCYDTSWRAARVICLGGREFKSWGRMALKMLEKWAVAEECDALELVGRKGWGRVFPDYKPIEYVYAKEF